MASWWRALPRAIRRYPWPANVVLYSGLFSAGDALQQRLRDAPPDWQQTGRVAALAMTFHANFNYAWLRLLERALPGRAPRVVLAKLLCDQTVGAPVAISAFYCGMSILQGKDDIFLDLKQKFWNTYTCALMYWPFVQLTNFALIPIHWRTAYTGLCGFFWATFLCYSQQSGDGTLESAFASLHLKFTHAVEGPSENCQRPIREGENLEFKDKWFGAPMLLPEEMKNFSLLSKKEYKIVNASQRLKKTIFKWDAQKEE